MADHTYTQADLNYIYQTLINGGAKLSDIPRITKNLGSSFTLADLKSKANLAGLSSTSQALWNQALSTMGNAESLAAQPAATTKPAATTTSTAQNPTDIVSQYMAPQGSVSTALQNMFLGGNPNQQPFHAATSPAEQWFMQQLGGLQPTQASPIENMINAYAGQGPNALIQQMTAPASTFENILGRYAGMGPQGLTPAASSFEQNLGLLGTNPYLAQIAAGQIPQSQMNNLNAQLALGQKQAMEAAGMGGALTSSDFAEGLARAQDDARTKFLSDMSQQAQGAQNILTNTLGTGGQLYGNRTNQGLQAFMDALGQGGQMYGNRMNQGYQTGANLWQNLLGAGLGAQQFRQNFDLNKMMGFANPLLSTQTGANENALTRFLGLGQSLGGQQAAAGENATQRAFQDYISKQGLPPELQTLLTLLGAGGSTTTTKGSQTVPLGPDLLKAVGQGAGAYLSGGATAAIP